jgi:SAM-dependent methyltransferase
MVVMRILNIGCGKDYIEGALNIDINTRVKADLYMDIGSADFFKTAPLLWGSIDTIIAHDVLEHIPDLAQAMTNCRDLLKEGGEMDIIVPYDLSLGAWSDPTHVRAFNERSWVYYAEWAWYIGWEDYAFACAKCELQCADWVDKSLSADQLSRLPRAVDSMKVTLKKVKYVAPKE